MGPELGLDLWRICSRKKQQLPGFSLPRRASPLRRALQQMRALVKEELEIFQRAAQQQSEQFQALHSKGICTVTRCVAYAPGHALHQLMMWDGVEVPFQVGIDYIGVSSI